MQKGRQTGIMTTNDATLRHLLDLCRKSEKTGAWQYSAFLSPAEQDGLLRCPEAAGFSFFLTGGYEAAERKILAAGNEEENGPAEPPVSVIAVSPKSEKYAEELTHRDYLGAILGLGIERSLIGDILVRDRKAWFFCLAQAAEMLASSLTQVRRTAVTAKVTAPDVPELQPRYAPLRLNVASERLDAVTAAFTNLSRGQADRLFGAEKVFVNGRAVTDRSAKLKEGDILSVRGFGKAVYDGRRLNRLPTAGVVQVIHIVVQAQAILHTRVQETGVQGTHAANPLPFHHGSVFSLYTGRKIHRNPPGGKGADDGRGGIINVPDWMGALPFSFQQFRIQAGKAHGCHTAHNNIPFHHHGVLVSGKFRLKVIDATSQKGQQGCQDNKLLLH